MRVGSLLFIMLLSACSARTGMTVSTGAGGSAPQGSASIHLHAAPTVGTLIGLGFLAAFVRGDSDYAERSVPELDPTRRVNVQDCTRPIEDWSLNLKCR